MPSDGPRLTRLEIGRVVDDWIGEVDGNLGSFTPVGHDRFWSELDDADVSTAAFPGTLRECFEDTLAGAKAAAQAAALRAVLRDYPPLEAPDPDRPRFRSEELHREILSWIGRLGRWWDACTHRVNGVFQGGGAKGIAYAGALRSLRDHDRWFNAVAGASAGAITAVLVAAGFDPDQMESRTREGLQSVRPVRPWMHVLAMFGVEMPIYETSGLYLWLTRELRAQIAALTGVEPEPGQPVTFGMLHEATGIDLFIVALDIDAGVPRVMSHHNAPNGDVARAAVASSSIPAAMRSQPYVVARFTGADGSERARLTKLVDGGAWANYPRFVFSDPSFRVQHLGRGNEQDPHPTIGFVLRPSGRDAQRPKPRTWKVVLITALVAAAAAGLTYAVGGNNTVVAATAAAAAAAIWLGRRVLIRAVIELMKWFAETGWMRVVAAWVLLLVIIDAIRSWRHTYGLVEGALSWTPAYVETFLPPIIAYGLIFAVPPLLVTLLGLVRMQTWLATEAPKVLDASLGAATGVPDWAGWAPGDYLVRVPVCPSIGTTDFDLPDDVRRAVIDNAEQGSSTQLQAICAEIEGTASRWVPTPALLAMTDATLVDVSPESAPRARAETNQSSIGCLAFWGWFLLVVFAGSMLASKPEARASWIPYLAVPLLVAVAASWWWRKLRNRNRARFAVAPAAGPASTDGSDGFDETVTRAPGQ